MDVSINKLKTIINTELKYKDLCSKLGLKQLGGNSKTKQLQQLESYCNIQKLSKPTRYIITEVYDEEILALTKITNNDKFQLYFEAALYRKFLENNGNPIAMDNMEILKLFTEINENFPYTCSKDNMSALGNEFIYMTEMGQTVYRILWRWTERRLKGMEARGIIVKSSGYRLFTEIKFNFGTFKSKFDVPEKTAEISSPLHDWCGEIYYSVVKEIMPNNWDGGWVTEWKWNQFRTALALKTREKSNGQYCDLKRITILKPLSKNWLNNRLQEIYQEYPDLKAVNTEAQNKILKTTQLDTYTNQERKLFIDTNITPFPQFLFKDKLKELREKQKQEG